MSTDATDDLRLLLQITDSVFPTGAYAHSFGLETYVQEGAVADGTGARSFVAHSIAYPLAFTELLSMRLAYEAMAVGYPAGVAELEAELRATRAPSEVRGGLERMASRFAKTVDGFLDGDARVRFAGFLATSSVHLVAVSYGAFAQCAGIDLRLTLECYLYNQVSAIVANCVKLVPLSQTEGQRILRESSGLQGRAVDAALSAPRDLLGISSPGLDVRCIEHETLYSRLYMS